MDIDLQPLISLLAQPSDKIKEQVRVKIIELEEQIKALKRLQAFWEEKTITVTSPVLEADLSELQAAIERTKPVLHTQEIDFRGTDAGLHIKEQTPEEVQQELQQTLDELTSNEQQATEAEEPKKQIKEIGEIMPPMGQPGSISEQIRKKAWKLLNEKGSMKSSTITRLIGAPKPSSVIQALKHVAFIREGDKQPYKYRCATREERSEKGIADRIFIILNKPTSVAGITMDTGFTAEDVRSALSKDERFVKNPVGHWMRKKLSRSDLRMELQEKLRETGLRDPESLALELGVTTVAIENIVNDNGSDFRRVQKKIALYAGWEDSLFEQLSHLGHVKAKYGINFGMLEREFISRCSAHPWFRVVGDCIFIAKAND